MRFTRKHGAWLGAILTVVVVLLVTTWTWGVPALIVRTIQAQVEGHVAIDGWWLNGRSAGVTGLTLHESAEADSPVLARVASASTDLTPWRLLRGAFMPTSIVLDRPEIQLRVDPKGRIQNLPTLTPKGSDSDPGASRAWPSISVNEAKVWFRRTAPLKGQSDPGEMSISHVTGKLEADSGGRTMTLSGHATDPTWGTWQADGSIDPGQSKPGGKIRLSTERMQADPATLAQIPFIPSEIWTHVEPRGPVGVEVGLDWATGREPTFQANTRVTLLGTSARFPSLDLSAEGTSGHLEVEGTRVRVSGVTGKSIGGEVVGGGTIDFGVEPTRIELNLGLKEIDVEKTPHLWQLDDAGIKGRLTGKVELRARLGASGVDLTGTTGHATVENAQIQGIPVKRLRLALRAQGEDLEYDTQTPEEARSASPMQRWLALMCSPSLIGVLPSQPLLVASQQVDPPTAVEPRAEEEKAQSPKVRLPKTITTEIELEDVEVAELVVKAQTLLGFPFPVPVTGKLNLKAKATIPLGAMRDIKQYKIQGEAVLDRASIFKVDLAHLEARLDLSDGRLELKDLRGVLVDRPDGGPDNPPNVAPPSVPLDGAMPAGAFRGRLVAELDPLGQFSANFEGNQLPIGELAAPLLPRPTPLSGQFTFNVEGKADLAKASDPSAWTVTGTAESQRVSYQNAVLDHATLQFRLAEGWLEIPALKARMAGRPLDASGKLELNAPGAYEAKLNVEEWDLATVLTLIPQAPHPSPISGRVTAQAVARGTTSPWALNTEGKGQIKGFQAASVPLGLVPFRWSTDRDSILISDVKAQPFGGTLEAEAHVPIKGGGAPEGNATLSGIDTAKLSEAIPGQGISLAGIAEGSIAFVLPSKDRPFQAKVRIQSTELTFQGIPAQQIRASVNSTNEGVLNYEVDADSLGGKVKVRGGFPLSGPVRTPIPPGAADGVIRFAGFSLSPLWKAVPGASILSDLNGQGSFDASYRNQTTGPEKDRGLWLRGRLNLGGLTWSRSNPLGEVGAILAKSPSVWRVDRLTGELMGGTLSGAAWGSNQSGRRANTEFKLRVERASLSRLLTPLPDLASRISGLATLDLKGRMDPDLRAELGIKVDEARFSGVPIQELQAPLTVLFSPSSGEGNVLFRQVSSRVAGGMVRGSGSLKFGRDRAFQGQLQLTSVDLQALTRLMADSRHPASGRISGQIRLSGTDLKLPQRYRGQFNLDLDDAALFSIPIFREVEKFFGSARGGLFEDGDLVGTIANRELLIESLALEGRIVQLHATGTVGFDSQLNLEVLVNTNQLVPETGKALLALIPGLKEVLGRREQAISKVGSFLSNRLLKLRVTGTLQNPSITVDSSVLIAETAVVFFSGALKLPLGFLR